MTLETRRRGEASRERSGHEGGRRRRKGKGGGGEARGGDKNGGRAKTASLPSLALAAK